MALPVALLYRHDGLMAAGLLAMGLVEALLLTTQAPLWTQVPATFVWTVPLLWRRRWPVQVLAVVIAMGPLLDLVNSQGGIMSFVLSAIVASYSVGRLLDPPATWWGPALTVGVGWVNYAAIGGQLSDFVFVALLYGGAWAVGHAIRRRDLEVGDLTREAEELHRAQAERERRAVEQERVRIARELHDIVAHSISVITIQAQAVRHRLLPSYPEEAAALHRIETTAREAMAEMRRLLGILRAEDEPAALAPQPGMHQLPTLIAEARAVGLDVEVAVEGTAVPLPPGIDLAAYRVIQEALTNVRKHSGAKTSHVILRYHVDTLTIVVADEGPSVGRDGRAPANVSGQGLAGMRERIQLYGGSLRAERADRGFCVSVSLPLAPERSAT